MQPFHCSDETGGEWLPLPAAVSYSERYLRSIPSEHKYYCLAMKVQVRRGQAVQLAYCVPYTYSMLRDRLRGLAHVAWESLGGSLGGVDIPLLTVGNGPVLVMVSARVHPG